MSFTSRKHPRPSTVVQASGTPLSNPQTEVKKEPESPQIAPAEAANENAVAPVQEDLQDTKR